MTKKTKRLALFLGAFIVAAAAVGLTLTALRSSITYFYTPSELAALPAAPTSAIRLGGLVEAGSVDRAAKTQAGEDGVAFAVTDGGAIVRVEYGGILPDLFREGQGVVVQGRMIDAGYMAADTVLAKHDENYMPKEVADALKEQGRWKDGAYAE